METEYEAAETLINLGAALTELSEVNGVKVAVVPAGYNLQTLENLSKYAENPIRKEGITELFQLEDFIEFVKKHQTPETLILVDDTALNGTIKMKAIFNFHGDKPGHKDYGAGFRLSASEEFEGWLGIARGKNITQEELVEFLEDNIHTIAEPSGAVLKEICANLTARREQKISNSFSSQNGDITVVFSEQSDIKAPKDVKIPSVFTLGISPYPRSVAYKVDLRLRTRIVAGVLNFNIKWNRLDKLRQVISDDSINALRKSLPDIQVLRGSFELVRRD